MRAARTDQTHADVIKWLRGLGWLVIDTHRLVNFVDAVAYKAYSGVYLIEIKRDRKAPLTASQQRLIDAGWPLIILWDFDSVLAFHEGATL